jgi:hypothetical protein
MQRSNYTSFDHLVGRGLIEVALEIDNNIAWHYIAPREPVRNAFAGSAVTAVNQRRRMRIPGKSCAAAIARITREQTALAP